MAKFLIAGEVLDTDFKTGPHSLEQFEPFIFPEFFGRSQVGI